MDELCFRVSDRRNPSVRYRVAFLLALPAVHITAALLEQRGAWIAWVYLVMVPPAIAFVLASRRGWTRVGWEGVRISPFGGRGRLIPWVAVRSVRTPTVRQYRIVQLLLADGRRRTLPGLAESARLPDPGLSEKIRQLDAWYEQCGTAPEGTDASAVPRSRLARLPRSGIWQGVAALLLLIPLVGATAHAVGVERAASGPSFTIPAWVGAGGPVDGGHYLVTVDSLSVRHPLPGDTPALFRSPDDWLESLAYQDKITLRILPDGTVAAMRPAGGGAWRPTVDSPQSVLGSDLAALMPTALLFVVLACWSAALVRARRRGVRPGFRWWVPLSLAPLPLLFGINDRETAWPAPFAAADYRESVTVLFLGVLLGWLLARTRQPQG